jgi:hypothetical protein
MRRLSWLFVLGTALLALSAALYAIHFAIFRDAHHIYIYLLGDIAFLPIEVLLVTLVVHRLLSERERRGRLEKLNMVIGAFFSEVGGRLLAYFSDFDPKLAQIREDLMVANGWTQQDFARVDRKLRRYDYSVELGSPQLEGLRTFLAGERDFLLRLLENPTLRATVARLHAPPQGQLPLPLLPRHAHQPLRPRRHAHRDLSR